MSQLNEFLKKASANWKEHAEKAKEGPKYDNLPDGRYTALLKGAEVGFSKTSDRPQITWIWQILEGEYRGERVYGYQSIEDEDALYRLGRTLMTYGYDPLKVDLKKLPAILDEIVNNNSVAQITLKTRKDSDFQGVYLDKLVDDYDGDLGEDEKPKSKSSSKKKTEEEKPDPPAKSSKSSKSKKKEEDEEDEPEEEEEEDEEEEEEEEEVELAVGMKVTFTWKEESLEGIVKEILEDEGKVKIKSDGKTYTTKPEKITMISGEGKSV